MNPHVSPGYARLSMSQTGTYRLHSRNRAFEAHLDPRLRSERRIERILDSLRREIRDEQTEVRVRRIFEQPREIFRLEIASEVMGYQRTTLLDRDCLEELLAHPELRERIDAGIG